MSEWISKDWIDEMNELGDDLEKYKAILGGGDNASGGVDEDFLLFSLANVEFLR